MLDNNNAAVNEEIVAVISAAIAAMETRPGYRLVVKSIKRVPIYSPVWNTSARIENLMANLNKRA